MLESLTQFVYVTWLFYLYRICISFFKPGQQLCAITDNKLKRNNYLVKGKQMFSL